MCIYINSLFTILYVLCNHLSNRNFDDHKVNDKLLDISFFLDFLCPFYIFAKGRAGFIVCLIDAVSIIRGLMRGFASGHLLLGTAMEAVLAI